MSKLEELIQQYCPDGVEYKSIESITKNICSGLNPRKNFTLNGKGANCYYLTVKEMTTGKIVFSDKTDKITPDAVNIIQNRSRLETDDILLSGIGTIGKVAIVDIPVDNWNCSESVLLLKPNKDIICPKYLKYILEGNETQAYFNSHATGSTLKGIRQKDLRTHSIPVPPLPVQEEIVRILDSFTELQAELQAELQKRLQQYNYYRDKLLSFNELNRGGQSVSVEWKKLGDVADLGTGSHNTQDGLVEGQYPFYTRGSEILYLNDYDYDETAIITAGDGAGVGKVFHFVQGKYALHQRAYRIVPNEKIMLARFVYYYIGATFYNYIMKSSVSSSVVSIRKPMMVNYPIPVPSLEEQQKIVDILDRFDTLTTDITAGLPAEIEARRKQYEYYRDQLLTFKQKA